MNLLFLGDIVGKPGRLAVRQLLLHRSGLPEYHALRLVAGHVVDDDHVVRLHEDHRAPLGAARDGDDVVILASNAARSYHPNWYYNLHLWQPGRLWI